MISDVLGNAVVLSICIICGVISVQSERNVQSCTVIFQPPVFFLFVCFDSTNRTFDIVLWINISLVLFFTHFSRLWNVCGPEILLFIPSFLFKHTLTEYCNDGCGIILKLFYMMFPCKLQHSELVHAVALCFVIRWINMYIYIYRKKQ